jgi:hypothetical protein
MNAAGWIDRIDRTFVFKFSGASRVSRYLTRLPQNLAGDDDSLNLRCAFANGTKL